MLGAENHCEKVGQKRLQKCFADDADVYCYLLIVGMPAVLALRNI